MDKLSPCVGYIKGRIKQLWLRRFTRGFYAKFNGIQSSRYTHNDGLGVKVSLYAQRHDWRKFSLYAQSMICINFPFRNKGNISQILHQSLYDHQIALPLVHNVGGAQGHNQHDLSILNMEELYIYPGLPHITSHNLQQQHGSA